jgi:hypothetical protein
MPVSPILQRSEENSATKQRERLMNLEKSAQKTQIKGEIWQIRSLQESKTQETPFTQAS